MPTREQIQEALRAFSEAENARPNRSAEEVVAALDLVMAENVEGWANGRHSPTRAHERVGERAFFEAVPDYHRSFDRIIIDSPFAAVDWTITGTANGTAISAIGSTTFEIDDDGKVRRFWLYADNAQFAALQR